MAITVCSTACVSRFRKSIGTTSGSLFVCVTFGTTGAFPFTVFLATVRSRPGTVCRGTCGRACGVGESGRGQGSGWERGVPGPRALCQVRPPAPRRQRCRRPRGSPAAGGRAAPHGATRRTQQPHRPLAPRGWGRTVSIVVAFPSLCAEGLGCGVDWCCRCVRCGGDRQVVLGLWSTVPASSGR